MMQRFLGEEIQFASNYENKNVGVTTVEIFPFFSGDAINYLRECVNSKISPVVN